MKLYMALNEPGSGEISIHASDPAASGASMGKFVQMAYRGEARGGFFIEDIGKTEAAAGEKGEQWVALTGRGTLAILEEAIVWQEDGEATRTFEGLSMAGILLALIDEAQERGALAVLDTDFSATLDSASEAWEDSETLEFDVGTSLLDVARQFAELGIDFGITAWLDGQFRLSAYKNGLGLNKSASVILRVGQNCSELSDTWHGTEMRNALLTEYANGYVTKQDGTISTLYRRREGFFQANGAATSGAANRMAQAELARLKDPMRAITVKVYDGVGPRVFVDYEAGDWVGLAREDGSVESWRVRGVQLEWQDDWYADVIVELNSVLMETELRMARQMRRVGGASVGAATSAPAKNDKAVKKHNADSGAHNGRLGNAERIWSRNITTQAPQDKHILRWDVAANMFVFSPIGDFPHVHSAADVTSGTLDGDRLPAMSASKQGAVPATGTPSGKYLKDNGTFDTPAGGSTPGGADTNVQVNDGGVLAGFSTFTFRKVNPALKVGNLLFDCADVTGSKAINWRDRAGIPAFTDELVAKATYPTPQFNLIMFKDDYSNFQDSGKKTTDFEPANANIQGHIGSTSNPHSVTAAQAGADITSGTTHAATSKTTPVDADEVPILDSAATFGLKKLTWANIKATLKTYLDTLYQAVSAELTAIAGLSPSNDDVIQRKSGAWTNRTMAQLAGDLATPLQSSAIRKKLTANTTYYVATTGNDTTGDGTSGNPWATIQKAYDYIVANLDVAGYTVTIQVADGTYTAGLVAASSWSGGGSVVIQGNTGNKNSVYVSVTSKHCFQVSIGVVLSGALTLKYLKLATTTSGSGIYHSGIGIVNFNNINFAACVQYHVVCDNAGGVVYVNGAYEISGNAAAHWIAGGGGVVWGYGQTATISANLTFSLGFIYASVLGIVKSTMTWSLGAYAVTGTRYHTYSNAAVYVAGTGANHFPGNSAGATDGYGYYG
jgi:hypothetical protein